MGGGKRERPPSNEFAIVDHAVGVQGSVGDEEADDNVDEESNLAGDVEEEEILGQPSEEPKLQGSEEGRVHCP